MYLSQKEKAHLLCGFSQCFAEYIAEEMECASHNG